MRMTHSAAAVLLAACVPGAAMAQDDGPNAYIYSTYFICEAADEAEADEFVESVMAPVYDAAVDSGDITAWGYMQHHTGGMWRRALYRVAPTLDAIIDAGTMINEKIDQAADDDDTRFQDACEYHEDYIWANNNPGPVGQERGDAGFSVYFVCDENREQRADEIVNEHFAPIYDRFVEEGKLASWGWLEHWVGGRYRRLATMTASDHKTLLNTRNEIISALYDAEGMEEIGSEFTDICGSHQDYMWNVLNEKP